MRAFWKRRFRRDFQNLKTVKLSRKFLHVRLPLGHHAGSAMNQLPKAILFDHDGVLVASEPLHEAAWKQLLAELGLPFEEADFRTLIGKTAPQIITSLLDRFAPGWDPAKMKPDELALRKN